MGGGGGELQEEELQGRQAAAPASVSLSVPSPQDGRQVLLHRHLLAVAAVAVREDAVRVALGQQLLLAGVHQGSSAGGGETPLQRQTQR